MPKIDLAPTTYVTFLLDKSGSMNSARQSTIDAFNAYLAELKKAETPIVLSLLQFDSQAVEKTCVRTPIRDVQALTLDTYVPRGGTPLIDAAYEAIEATRRIPKAADDKVVICIQTDGQENESRAHTFTELNSLIRARMEDGWQFNFMGVGLDAYNQAARMGIGRASTMSYDIHNDAMTERAFYASAVNTANFASGMSASTAYSMAQKLASGDDIDPGSSGAPAVNPPKPKPFTPPVAQAPRAAVEPIDL